MATRPSRAHEQRESGVIPRIARANLETLPELCLPEPWEIAQDLPRAPVSPPKPPSAVQVRLHRRRQIVVVRAGDARASAEPPPHPKRRRVSTLIGLDQRERLDTFPDGFEELDPPSSRTRPVVLIDGIDDERAEAYRAEAERILREGLLVDVGQSSP